MDIALAVVGSVMTLAIIGVVVWLFVWAAVKDGEENDEVQGRVRRRAWPSSARSVTGKRR